jgi:hypothetical protein
MSLHINRFIDSIKAHEARGQKDFTMSMRDAKDLHADVTRLLAELLRLHQRPETKDEVMKVEIQGGTF